MIGRRPGDDFDPGREGPLSHLVRGPAPDDPLAGQSVILAACQYPVIAPEPARAANVAWTSRAILPYGASLRTALKSVHIQPVCRSSVCVKRIR